MVCSGAELRIDVGIYMWAARDGKRPVARAEDAAGPLEGFAERFAVEKIRLGELWQHSGRALRI